VEHVEADWVVVGGGSAGAATASRLSEDRSKSVVLLEAGPDWRSHEAPAELRSMNGWRALDEEMCGPFQWTGLTSRRTSVQEPLPHLRGRGLGGSSTVNGMIAIRATPVDYDRWASFGCPGWSYEEVLPYLRRMEDDADFGDRPYHGDAGPFPVMRLPREQWGPVDDALARRAAQLGYGWCDDHNAPDGSGVSPYGVAARHGARVSTNDAYLEPARERENLRIVGDATVDRVLLHNGRATGVRVRIDGVWTDVHADRIVLCAGAIHSPAILLRSGIGPEGSVVSLPVGQGLQDHPIALFWLFLRPEFQPDPDAHQTNCCIRYSSGLADAGPNDMIIVAINQTLALPPDVAAAAASPEASGTWGGFAGGQATGGPGLLGVWNNHQESRGTLRLASPDPDVQPVIDENLLDDPGDLARLRDGVRRSLDLLAGSEFAERVDHIGIDLTGRGVDHLTDDSSIDNWLLNASGDAGHISCTCRMGAPDDPRSVVDPQGRVLGVDGLWVADASVFPEVPRANTNMPTIAAAERLSDLIRGAADRSARGTGIAQ
jgi:5-(hydroxymethyl)furfural/furfural oxidase